MGRFGVDVKCPPLLSTHTADGRTARAPGPQCLAQQSWALWWAHARYLVVVGRTSACDTAVPGSLPFIHWFIHKKRGGGAMLSTEARGHPLRSSTSVLAVLLPNQPYTIVDHP